MTDINKIINDLSDDLEPVKVMPSPGFRTVVWLLCGLSYVVILPIFLDIRPDLAEKFTQPLFIAEIIIAALGSILACLSASYLATPDTYQKPSIKWIATIPFIALTILLIYCIIDQRNTTVPINTTLNTYQCFADMFAFAAFPIIVMLYLCARQGATTHCNWSGAMIGLSSVNFSYIALRVVEQNDSAKHILLWHYTPMILTVLIGIILGRKFLKW